MTQNEMENATTWNSIEMTYKYVESFQKWKSQNAGNTCIFSIFFIFGSW